MMAVLSVEEIDQLDKPRPSSQCELPSALKRNDIMIAK